MRVPLASQPLKLLALLVRRAGDLVTREEIQQELWTKGAVVDFEHLVNQYIRQLRSVLGDSRESPTFIETAPRRGYRFIAPVNAVSDAVVPTLSGHPASNEVAASPALTSVERSAPMPVVRSRRRYLVTSIASVTVILVAVAVIVLVHRASQVGLPSHTSSPGQLQTGKEPSSPSGAVSQHPEAVPSSRAAEARAAYEKGKYFFNQSTVEGLQKSCEYFRKSLEADPANALAYNGMADCYLALVANGLVAADEFMPKAKAMATKSIELDGSLAEGHVALGALLLNYEWNWPAAHAELDKAVRLDPAGLDGH